MWIYSGKDAKIAFFLPSSIFMPNKLDRTHLEYYVSDVYKEVNQQIKVIDACLGVYCL